MNWSGSSDNQGVDTTLSTNLAEHLAYALRLPLPFPQVCLDHRPPEELGPEWVSLRLSVHSPGFVGTSLPATDLFLMAAASDLLRLLVDGNPESSDPLLRSA